MQSIFVLLVVLGCISTASALQCYMCDSGLKAGCGDPFDTNSMGDSDKMTVPAGGVCMKTKAEAQGITAVGRAGLTDQAQCAGYVNSCGKQTAGGVTATICCCSTDLCNSVSALRQQPLTILFLTITTFAMFIYRCF